LAEQISQMATGYIKLLESFRQLQSRSEREWTSEVISQGSVSSIVEETLKSLVRLTSYRGVAFFLLEGTGAGLQLKQYLHQSLQPIRACQRNLLEADYDRQALLSGQAICRRREHHDAQWLPDDVQTGLCVRVANSEGILGTLWAYDRRIRSVEDRDLHVVQSIAAQLGVLLDRAVTTHESAHHRRLKTELRLASITQPAKSLAFTTPGGELQAYGKCMSQFDLGGDLCEIIPLQDQGVLMLVGDASGNSIPAAMVMTAVRGAIYALATDLQDAVQQDATALRQFSPALFMQKLNRMLVGLTAAHQFMSCVCALFLPASRELRFCNAGHPSPIHLGQAGVSYLPSHGLLLGIDETVQYEQSRLGYRPGDTFIFYSDGISEAIGQANRLFRQDGIATAARNYQHQTAEEIVNAIWNQMQAHQSGETETDDATLLAVKCGREA